MKRNTISEIKLIGKKLSEDNEFIFKPIKFKCKSGYAGRGTTTTAIPEGKKKIKRYVKVYIPSNTDIFPSEKVALTDALVCLFHEFHHVKQFYDMENGIATEEVIVSFLASQNNDDVYHDNYAYLPHELEAERNGIKNAYNYLHDNKPDLDAFQCIKEYIEFKISIGDRRYKQRGFDFSTIHSIIEIDSVFQTNIEESYNHELDMIQIHRAYSGNKIRMCNETYEINLIYKLLLELDNYESSNDKILGLLESGMPQLKFIASYVLKEHPIYADFFKKYHIPSFENYIEAYNSLIETINKEYSEKRIYMNKQDKMDKFKEYIECL